MIPYAVFGTGENRVLVVMANASLRFKFWNIKDGKREEVKFRRSGGRIIGLATPEVLVYKKPHAMQYHKEYMLANSRALWMGLQSEPDRLLDNMLEYVETI